MALRPDAIVYTMKNELFFNKIDHSESILSLVERWRKTLTAPQDGMWESFLEYATKVEIRADNRTIGYACLNDENQLLQCFLTEQWLEYGEEVLAELINQFEITSAMVGTNNPIFLSLCLPFQKTVEVHTLLFYDALEPVSTNYDLPPIKLAWQEDLALLVNFYNESIGAPKEWLNQYLGNLISRGELFFLLQGSEILGTCEVRNSDSDVLVADIGMVVSKDHRLKGYGGYLLSKAKELAYDQGRKPICSCEAQNIGSLKSIHKNGFRSIHQILRLSF